jgi:hypothetical protein
LSSYYIQVITIFTFRVFWNIQLKLFQSLISFMIYYDLPEYKICIHLNENTFKLQV